MPSALPAIDLELTEEQEQDLVRQVQAELGPALEAHRQREARAAKLHLAYKAKPETERKNFPWPGASNVVIPIVGITVDAIVARLMRSVLGLQHIVEAQIKEAVAEFQEKDFRDWADMFFQNSGARNTLRTVFHDSALDGTVFVKVRWDSVKRPVDAYDLQSGQITHTDVVDYEGPVWDAIPVTDLLWPPGYDEFNKLPWVGHILRLSWAELKTAERDGMYSQIDDTLKGSLTANQSSPVTDVKERAAEVSSQAAPLYRMLELWGTWEIKGTSEDAEPEYVNAILTYSLDDHRFHRKIRNPFFGQPRHIVRVPFLHQPHEIEGMSAAEQVHQFQVEASTAHNQAIDASTAAIAGIVVRKPSTTSLTGKEIFPGAELVADDPKNDFAVFHLTMGNGILPDTERTASFWAEKRSGVSPYNLGVESPVAGSRATATGTTALISEGNMRFWVSIDDMKDALTNLLFLTLQLEQQIRPDGTPISSSRVLQLPQGDLRSIIGLQLAISSEKVNRDLEIQNFQLLMTVLNEYYSRVMQAAAILMNPAFPPGQKLVIMTCMDASNRLVKRFVERFDIQNIDEVVPGLTQAMQMIGGVLGPAAVANPSALNPGAGSGIPPGGFEGNPGTRGQGPERGGPPPNPGQS